MKVFSPQPLLGDICDKGEGCHLNQEDPHVPAPCCCSQGWSWILLAGCPSPTAHSVQHCRTQPGPSSIPAELGMPLVDPGSWLQQVPYVLMWPLCAVVGPKSHTGWRSCAELGRPMDVLEGQAARGKAGLQAELCLLTLFSWFFEGKIAFVMLLSLAALPTAVARAALQRAVFHPWMWNRLPLLCCEVISAASYMSLWAL